MEDTDNTLRAGPRGPALLEDFHFREKIMHFDHERTATGTADPPSRPLRKEPS